MSIGSPFRPLLAVASKSSWQGGAGAAKLATGLPRTGSHGEKSMTDIEIKIETLRPKYAKALEPVAA